MGILASSQITITDLTDGEGAITLILSNDSHALPASSTGAVSSYAGSGTELRVYEGSTLLNYKSQLDTLINGSWKLVSNTATNITPGAVSSGAAIGGKVLSAVAENSSGVAELVDTSTIVYTVQVKNLVGNVTTVTKQQSITKAKAGIPSSYVVINGEQVFKFLAGAVEPTSTNITLSAELFGGLNTFAWEYYSTSNTWEAFSDATLSTFSLTYNNAAWSSRVSLRVRCRSGTAYDETTIVKLYDANDVYTLTYTNQVLAVPVTTGGVEDWTSSGGRLQFFRGITALTLDSNSGSSTAPTDSSRFALDITKVSGNTLTVPSISGAETNITTLGNWEGNLEGPTVYRLSTRVKVPNGTTVLRQIDVMITPAIQGAPGLDGSNTAIVSIYKIGTSSTSPPSGDISGNFTYTFSTKTLTAVSNSGVFNSWSNTLPTATSGKYIWVRQATAYSNIDTDTIESSEFSGAVCLSGTGTNGLNSATVYLYRVSTSNSVAPDLFSGNFRYTFATKTLTAVLDSGDFNSWTTTPPTVPQGSFLWVRQATASSNTSTDIILIDEWSVAVVISGSGSNGAPGVGISLVNNYYYKSTSNTGVTVDNVAWSTTVPTLDATNKYLWNYERITYTDSTQTEPNYTNSTPAVIGTYSIDGKGISSITEYYAVSDSNTIAPTTDWATTIQTTTTTNRYLWNYETINYTIGNPLDTVKRVIGTHGATGAQGPSVQVTTSRPAVFSFTDNVLNSTGNEEITFTVTVSGVTGTPTWSFRGFPTDTIPTNSGTPTQTITSAQFGTSRAALVTCTVGAYSDTVTIERLDKSTAEAGATVGADSSNLQVGLGVNLLTNAGMVNGYEGFNVYGGNVGLNYPGWNIKEGGVPFGTLFIAQYDSTSTTGAFYIDNPYRIPVVAGKRYEASAYTGAIRCNVEIYIDFYDAAGVSLGVGTSRSFINGGSNNSEVSGGATLSGYKRIGEFCTAPADAASARIVVWKTATLTGYNDSFLFATMPYFGEAGAGQTEPSAWAPGVEGDRTKSVIKDRVSLDTGGLTFTTAAAYISAGNYNSYAWPSSGGGFYLSSHGLLLGNYNNGASGSQWVEIRADGTVLMPGLSIANGNLYARGDIEASSLKANTLMVNTGNIKDLAVSTLNIGNNAVTVITSTNIPYSDVTGVASATTIQLGALTTSANGQGRILIMWLPSKKPLDIMNIFNGYHDRGMLNMYRYDGTSSGEVSFSIKFYRNNVLLSDQSISSTGYPEGSFYLNGFVDTPGPNVACTYKIVISSNVTYRYQVRESVFIITEAKK
jgi:hypothetical protein